MQGALQAASLNVFINTKLMTDKTHAAALDAQADALLSEYVPKADAVFTQVAKQLRTWTRRWAGRKLSTCHTAIT